jgi:hypothetical protein
MNNIDFINYFKAFNMDIDITDINNINAISIQIIEIINHYNLSDKILSFINILLENQYFNNLFKYFVSDLQKIQFNNINDAITYLIKIVYEYTINYNKEIWCKNPLFKTDYVIPNHISLSKDDIDKYNFNKINLIKSINTIYERLSIKFMEELTNSSPSIKLEFDNVITNINDLHLYFQKNIQLTQYEIEKNKKKDLYIQIKNIISLIYNLKINIGYPSCLVDDSLILEANNINDYDSALLFINRINDILYKLNIDNKNYIYNYKYNLYQNTVFDKKINSIEKSIVLSNKIMNIHINAKEVCCIIIDFIISTFHDNSIDLKPSILDGINQHFDTIIGFHKDFIRKIDIYNILNNKLHDDIILYKIFDMI